MATTHSTAGVRIGEAAIWSLLLVCLLLPISGALVPVPLGVSLLLGVLAMVWNKPRVNWYVLGPLILWYAWHVVGMIWTTDHAFGLFDLQVKAGLFLTAFVGMGSRTYDPRVAHKAMVAFTLGIIISMFFGGYKAWSCWNATHEMSCFSQSTLSYQLHPSYAAWYACWCMAWWGHRLVGHELTRNRGAVVVLLLLLLVWIMLLASKSGVIGAVVVLAWVIVRGLLRTSGRMRKMVLGFAVLGVLVAVTARGGLVAARMQAAITAVQHAMDDDPALVASSDGNDLRLVAWSCSWRIVSTEPCGAGTGDVKQALRTCYQQKAAEQALVRNLNSHSQYLQGGAALGWLGLLLAVLLVLVPLGQAWKTGNVPLLAMAVLLLLNAAVESVLEVQAGVVFVGLFFGLFAFNGRTSSEVVVDP